MRPDPERARLAAEALARARADAWARGERPRIEDHLDQIAIPFRPALFRDLLAAELAARRRLGENSCPSCGAAMRLVRSIPKIGGLPELESFECRACRVSITEAVAPKASEMECPVGRLT